MFKHRNAHSCSLCLADTGINKHLISFFQRKKERCAPPSFPNLFLSYTCTHWQHTMTSVSILSREKNVQHKHDKPAVCNMIWATYTNCHGLFRIFNYLSKPKNKHFLHAPIELAFHSLSCRSRSMPLFGRNCRFGYRFSCKHGFKCITANMSGGAIIIFVNNVNAGVNV